jgi:hypothetical protein
VPDPKIGVPPPKKKQPLPAGPVPASGTSVAAPLP